MIVLDGLPALSAFRIDRLNAQLAPLTPACTVRAAHFVYLVDADAGRLDRARICQILQAFDREPAAATLWVAPRVGTRSPWSSKASEILRGCGDLHLHHVGEPLDLSAVEQDLLPQLLGRLLDRDRFLVGFREPALRDRQRLLLLDGGGFGDV